MNINNVKTVVGAVNSLMSLAGNIAASEIASADSYSVSGDGGGGIFYFEGMLPSAARISGATTTTVDILEVTNATPIVIKTKTPHAFSTGQSVFIQNVGGNGAANGRWIITVTGNDLFTLFGSIGSIWNGPSFGGTASSVTITAAAVHGLSGGQQVSIQGETAGILGLNAIWQGVGVINPTVFSIAAQLSGTYGGNAFFGDGGVTVPSSQVAGRWIRLNSAPMNVRWYGATGGGSVDDSAAINAAIASASASNSSVGDSVFFPPGTYRLSHSIRVIKAVELFGPGGGRGDPAAVLMADVGVTAIVGDWFLTYSPANTANGGGSIVRSLGIRARGKETYNNWVANHPYSAGDAVVPSAAIGYLGFYYIAQNGGTSGSSEPVPPNPWPQFPVDSLVGRTVNDGEPPPTGTGIVWQAFEMAHGVRMYAAMKIEDCSIYSFGGDGIHIAADANALPIRPTANDWMLSNVLIELCSGHGLHVRGGDTNSGVAISVNSSSNGQWGIHDYSFLGNQYVGCDCESNGSITGQTVDISAATTATPILITTKTPHGFSTGQSVSIQKVGGNTAANGIWNITVTSPDEFTLFGSTGNGPYTPVTGDATLTVGGPYYVGDPNARTTFVGCYSEGNQNPSYLGSGTAVAIGGWHAAGFSRSSVGTILDAGGPNTPLAVNSNFANGGTTEVYLGERDQATVMMWKGPWESNNFTRLKFFDAGSWPQWMCFAGFNSPAYTAFAITGTNHPEGQSRFKAPRGLFVGPDVSPHDSGPILTSASAEPAPSGVGWSQNYWRVGDRVLNVNPLSNGVDSWVATARGAWVLPAGGVRGAPPRHWAANTQHFAGDLILATPDNGYTYRAIQNGAGLTAPTPPRSWPITVGGTVLDDGDWPVWQPNQSYPIGALVIPIPANRYIYRVQGTNPGINAGKSGSLQPAWLTTQSALVTDGGVTWSCACPYLVWECFGATGSTFSPRMALGGRLRHNMTADADYTLASTEQLNAIIEITDTGAVLTATRNIVLPTFDGAEWKVYNGTIQSLVFKTAHGTGVSVSTLKRQSLYCDGTNVQAAGPATP